MRMNKNEKNNKARERVSNNNSSHEHIKPEQTTSDQIHKEENKVKRKHQTEYTQEETDWILKETITTDKHSRISQLPRTYLTSLVKGPESFPFGEE